METVGEAPVSGYEGHQVVCEMHYREEVEGTAAAALGNYVMIYVIFPVLMWVLTFAFMVYRMGLEALVESYAFWRPSLRTLTFEDIPGIAKQGTEPRQFSLLIAALASQFIGTLILPYPPSTSSKSLNHFSNTAGME